MAIKAKLTELTLALTLAQKELGVALRHAKTSGESEKSYRILLLQARVRKLERAIKRLPAKGKTRRLRQARDNADRMFELMTA